MRCGSGHAFFDGFGVERDGLRLIVIMLMVRLMTLAWPRCPRKRRHAMIAATEHAVREHV